MDDRARAWLVFVFIGLFSLSVILGVSVDVVKPLYVGIRYDPNTKSIDERKFYNPGRYWVGPGQYFLEWVYFSGLFPVDSCIS